MKDNNQGTFLDRPSICNWSSTCTNDAVTTLHHPKNGNVPICGACLIAHDDLKKANKEANKKAGVLIAAYAMVGIFLSLFATYRPDRQHTRPHLIEYAKPPVGTPWFGPWA